jgi:hypothetical protein
LRECHSAKEEWRLNVFLCSGVQGSGGIIIIGGILLSLAVTSSWTPYFHDAYPPVHPQNCAMLQLRDKLPMS